EEAKIYLLKRSKKISAPPFFVKNYCTIQVAYGYRNFHNFRARIYLIQGLIFQVKQKPVKHSA
ncbi:hypothetical protein, partial [Enterococcus faecium]|uniref:hypothetical protein n=1 Tax=Enterococcus faecium TaxID=1352 RepID=UPI000F91091D